MQQKKRKAIFIDRDGVLNEMVFDHTHGIMDSPRRPEQVKAVPGASAFINAAKDLGYIVVVVTNQPGIAKGTLTVEELNAVNDRLASLMQESGAVWDALKYCPHHPSGGTAPCAEYVMDCQCRKPLPGMLLNAAEELAVSLPDSWMIGDGITDVQAGQAADCKTILVTKLKVNVLERFFHIEGREPDYICPDLSEALTVIRASC